MIYYRQLFFRIHKEMAGKSVDPETGFILHRAIPVTSVVGNARKKGTNLHCGYNPAMKNKRSDTPKVCWMHHACGTEDIFYPCKTKNRKSARGAQDSRAGLELSINRFD